MFATPKAKIAQHVQTVKVKSVDTTVFVLSILFVLKKVNLFVQYGKYSEINFFRELEIAFWVP